MSEEHSTEVQEKTWNFNGDWHCARRLRTTSAFLRCEENVTESGHRAEIIRRMRLLRRDEELRKEIEAEGLRHLQQSGINEISVWEREDLQIWLKNNENLVKTRKRELGQSRIWQWCTNATY